MNFDKTRKLLDKFEKMPFDYDKCIKMQIKIIDSIICGADNSGFSASCVGLGVIQKTHMVGDSPFMIIKLIDELYPQYDPLTIKVRKWVLENKAWTGKKARQFLKEYKVADKVCRAHPDVVEHWKGLSHLRKTREKKK